jgi:hypothetical protein
MERIFLDVASQEDICHECATSALNERKPMVATIGFFDGVHLGHRFLIDNVVSAAKEEGWESTVVTFDRHPREVLGLDFQPLLLSTLDEKLYYLAETAVDWSVILRFDKVMASMSAEVFMKRILYDRLNVRRLIMGYDNRFGYRQRESFENYVAYGQKIGLIVERASVFSRDEQKISSSAIRKLLEEGEIEHANRCLGYRYSFDGRVVKGFGNGRRLGFPTANVVPRDEHKLIPGKGVFAVRVTLTGRKGPLGGMLNIGIRPTFNGNGRSIEVNILNFEGDIYGEELEIEFVARIRDERKFDSLEALTEQLAADKKDIIALLKLKSYER